MATRDTYIATGDTVEDLERTLNIVLQRIADRLDKLEGIRGKTSFEAEGVNVVGDVIVRDDDDEIIHSME